MLDHDDRRSLLQRVSSAWFYGHEDGFDHDSYLGSHDDHVASSVYQNIPDNYCPCRQDDQPNDPYYPWSPYDTPYRDLMETSSPTIAPGNQPIVIWEVVFTCIVLFLMLVALVSDRVGADSVMLAALTLFMASKIISIPEGLSGFSNESVLTVLVLFIVAEGINRTGALDWYLGKLLGRPKTAASAQLRLMAPIAIVSAFLNNTPVVAVMIPIVQKWSRNIRMSVQQLLIPLSFASILGGTCTLIGTSTNLVVYGLLQDYDPTAVISIFDLGEFGVPVAFCGLAYILLLSPCLLPGGGGSFRCCGRGSGQGGDVVSPLDEGEDILLGARLTPWSPAAGRTVQRSGLRDTGGIYLVSVLRAETGHMHRAVSNDFGLNVGDILYFTGLVESFGQFCDEHGLEVVTNEVQASIAQEQQTEAPQTSPSSSALLSAAASARTKLSFRRGPGPELIESVPRVAANNAHLEMVEEEEDENTSNVDGEAGHRACHPDEESPRDIPTEIGCTKESLLEADEAERLRSISRMADLIRGYTPVDEQEVTPLSKGIRQTRRKTAVRESASSAPKIVVAVEKELVVVGIDSPDRPGLLLDISKGLLRLNLQLRHTEASVVGNRSVSIWRCDVMHNDDDNNSNKGVPIPDLEEIWSVLNALLSTDTGIQAIKHRGQRVIRARVTRASRLIDMTAAEVEFRQLYKAAIVAIKSGETTTTNDLSSCRFSEGDILILQASDESPLLTKPPEDFYAPKDGLGSRTTSVQSLVDLISRRKSQSDLTEGNGTVSPVSTPMRGNSAHAVDEKSDDDFFIGNDEEACDSLATAENGGADMQMSMTKPDVDCEAAWNDLQVLFPSEENAEAIGGGREFLTAMEVSAEAKWVGKNVRKIGLHKLPDLFLVSIERPVNKAEDRRNTQRISLSASGVASLSETSEAEGSVRTENKTFRTIDPEEPLEPGDVLWFSGPASAVGDLRKIPGLISYENEEVEKLNETVFDRRLVQAVISRKGPLVGKTVKEVRFRTKYGAAVIAVHREGKRVHEHPGNVKLQAGDVLLLEAGPSFLAKTTQNDRSFALLAEVEDSAPPRLWLLIPALVLTIAMLVVATAGWMSLLISGLLAAMLMVAVGILSEQEARDAVNWEVYVTIASAFGIGQALINSGVATAVAGFLVQVGEAVGMGDAGIIGAVYLATFLISNIVTNNAAAALIFPIAMEAAKQTSTDEIIMSYTVMLAASASFMTPFGYTTNLMIYGPGGYKYVDFVYFGTPMQIVLWILTTAILSVKGPFWVSWLITAGVLAAVCATRICNASISNFYESKKSLISRKTDSEEPEKKNQPESSAEPPTGQG